MKKMVYTIEPGKKIFGVKLETNAEYEKFLNFSEYRWFTARPLGREVVKDPDGERIEATRVEIVGLLRRKGELSNAEILHENFLAPGVCRMCTTGWFYQDDTGRLLHVSCTGTRGYLSTEGTAYAPYDADESAEKLGVRIPEGKSVYDWAPSQKTEASERRRVKRQEFPASELISEAELRDVLAHTVKDSCKIIISRAPETPKKVFDFIEVEFPVYGEEWHMQHKQLLRRYASYRIEMSRQFKAYGVPINCLKLYGVRRQREFISMMFCLKDSLLQLAQAQ